MRVVVKYDNIGATAVTRATRPVSWIAAARKEFERFPAEAQAICLAALTIAAEGGKAARRISPSR